METAKQVVADRVAVFLAEQDRYCSTALGYTETEARVEFIDPLFKALDWDMENGHGAPNSLKDVVREESQPTETSAKRPDYTFRIESVRRFFVEAKKPSVDIRTSRESAFQVRSYGWTGGLPVSVLTNFRDFRVYDTHAAPEVTDDANVGLLMEIPCEDLVSRFDELLALFGREAVAQGSLDTKFGAAAGDAIPIDKMFMDRLNDWRLKIAEDLWARYAHLHADEVNDLAQKVINRVVFVRMCEDRGIEGEGRLRSVAEGQDLVEIRRFFEGMDDRYNTGLFDVGRDPIQTQYALASSVFLEIVEELYLPRAPYSFSVLDANFLGQVYEYFLVKRLAGGPAGPIVLEDKPAYEGREIVTTPQPLVDEIVRRAVSGLIPEGGLSYDDIKALRIVDIAVGSGRFLLRAFDELVDASIAYFKRVGDSVAVYRRPENDYRLRFAVKCELLKACLYGVDIDYTAVEVARFSLLVKLLEDERHGTLPPGRKILPNLDTNVVWGNSVVGPDYKDEPSMDLVRPLDWQATSLAENFDAVVGNPPYMKTEEMKTRCLGEFDYYRSTYSTPYRQFDKYFVFIEKGLSVLREGGLLGMVVPNKWMTIESGMKIRQLLARKGVVAEIVDFGNELLFHNRSTYVCCLVLSQTPRALVCYRRVDDYVTWLASPSDKGMALDNDLIRDLGGKAWVLPSTPEERLMLSVLHSGSERLGDIADVVNGIQTSAEDVFPISKWTSLGGSIVFERDGRTWNVEEALVRPYLMDSAARIHSYLPVEPDALVIFPYEYGDNGEAVPIPPERLQAEFPGAWLYLSAYRTRLEQRSVSPPPAEGEFYRYGRHQALATAFRPNKIIYSVNQLGDKYGIDLQGVGFASGGTAGEVAIASPRGGYSLEFILALLNQPTAEFFLRKRGSPFRGGYFSRGSAVVADLPVPKVDFGDAESVKAHDGITADTRVLISVCMSLQSAVGRERERLEQKSQALQAQIGSRFRSLWGLP